MRVHIKVLILLVVVAVVTIGLMMVYGSRQREQLTLVLQDDKIDKEAAFDNLMRLKGRLLEGLTADYTNSDPMVSFIASSRDTAWARVAMKKALTAFRVDAIWIYGLDGSLAYSQNTIDSTFPRELGLPKGALGELFGRIYFCHFFTNTPRGLMEVRGATVHPSGDNLRKTPPRGYLLIGQLWDKNYLGELSNLVGGKVEIAQDPGAAPALDQLVVREGSITFPRTLAGWDKQPVARLSVGIKSNVVRNYSRRLRNEYLVTIISTILISLLILLFIAQWINLPLVAISNALKHGNSSYITRLKDDRTEFGEVARLMIEFFKQRETLLAEINAKEEAQAALRDNEERYRTLVESMGEGLVVLDREQQFLFANRAGHEILGVGGGELTGRSLREFADGPGLARLTALIEGTRSGSCNAELEIRRAGDGQKRLLTVTATPQHDRDGQFTGAFGVFTDITERRQTEMAVLQSQKFEAIGQLASGIANDFNAKLTAITGNAEMLQMKLAGNPELSGLAEKIQVSCKKAVILTKQLLSYARRVEYQEVPVNIHRTISTVAGIIEKNLDPKISMRQKLEAPQFTVLGDPIQLANAVLNMAANAREAMPGGGELTFATALARFDQAAVKNLPYKFAPGTYLQVTITDTGDGMTPEVKKHLFDPFFTTKDPAKHTGLGLASVYGIVKTHRGSLEFDSAPGKGTTVKLLLPLHQTGAPAASAGAGPV